MSCAQLPGVSDRIGSGIGNLGFGLLSGDVMCLYRCGQIVRAVKVVKTAQRQVATNEAPVGGKFLATRYISFACQEIF